MTRSCPSSTVAPISADTAVTFPGIGAASAPATSFAATSSGKARELVELDLERREPDEVAPARHGESAGEPAPGDLEVDRVARCRDDERTHLLAAGANKERAVALRLVLDEHLPEL